MISLLLLRYGLALDLAASVSEAPALVCVPQGAEPMLERALSSFKQGHPQYEGAIRRLESTYDDPMLVLQKGDEQPLVVQPTILAVDSLHPLHDLPFEHAQALLEDPASLRELRLVNANAIKQRGFALADEITIIDYAQRGPDLRPLAIEGTLPSLESFQARTYPLHTPLTTYVPAAGPWWQPWRRPPPAITAFMEFLRSDTGQRAWYGTLHEVSFLALGDVMLCRNVGRKIDEYGTTYPFGRVHTVLAEHDLVFANLESPIGVKGTPLPNKLIWFRADPEAAAALVHGGIHGVGLANNHILDYDSENLIETLTILDELGIARTGAGRNLAEARQPALLQAGDITVAVLAYTEFATADLFWCPDHRRSFLATETIPGCAPMDLSIIQEDVGKARQRADIVMVAYHWGQEYVNYPQAYFGQDLQEVARATIEAGADAVLGTHPHAIQGIEIYQGRPIAYSLGNFVMDQYEPLTTESMMLSLTLSEKGITGMKVMPVRISGHRPHLAQAEDAGYLMDKIRTISWPLRNSGA